MRAGHGVHVGRDQRHLVVAVDAAQVEIPDVAECRVEHGAIVVQREAPRVRPVVGEIAGDEDSPAVERAAQDEPPVHDPRHPVPLEAETPTGEQTNRCDLVVDEVRELLGSPRPHIL